MQDDEKFNLRINRGLLLNVYTNENSATTVIIRNDDSECVCLCVCMYVCVSVSVCAMHVHFLHMNL